MKMAKSLRKEATHGAAIPAGWRLACMSRSGVLACITPRP